MTNVLDFMNGALVTWAGTFKNDKLSYDELVDGIFLNKIMKQIDPGVKEMDMYSLNVSSRISNYERLLRHIITFYQTNCRQLVVMKLPDIVKIVKDPDSDSSLDEVNKVLLLLLGCAVQSERKEEFVEKIKTLELDTQAKLMDAIKLVTESMCSLSEEITENGTNGSTDPTINGSSDPLVNGSTDSLINGSTDTVMYQKVKQLFAERNDYYDVICDMYQDLEYYRGLVDKKESIVTSPKNGRNIENPKLANGLQLKIVELQEDNEEKSRQVMELTRDLEDRDLTITRLKLESSRLSEEKRNLLHDHDDLELLREKADEFDRLENEVFHLKQKSAELDFYKNRVEELRIDNNDLLERRTELEAKLEKSCKRSDSLIDEIVQYQIQDDQSKAERDQLKSRIQNMVEEQAQVEKERNKLINQLRLERDRAENEAAQALEGPSLSEELMNTTFTEEMYELQLENERLREQVDSIRDELEQDAKWRTMELQRKIAYLQAEVSKSKEKSKLDEEKIKQLELKLMEANRKYDRLDEDLSMEKDRHEAEIETYQNQLTELRRQIIQLRHRNSQENDVRYKEITDENVTMFNSVQNLSIQVNRLKFTNRFLRKSCDKLKEDVDKSAPFSDENFRLRTENDVLRRAAANAKVVLDVSNDLESRNLKLEIELRKSKKLVDILRTTLSRVDPLNRISYHYITSL